VRDQSDPGQAKKGVGRYRPYDEWVAREARRGRADRNSRAQLGQNKKELEPPREGKCNAPLPKGGKRCKQPKGKCVWHRGWDEA
jgi:hypothetical protein